MNHLQKKRRTINLYSWPMLGHILPILRIAQILQESQNDWDVKFFISEGILPWAQKRYPNIKMTGLKDQIVDCETVVQMSLKQAPKNVCLNFYAKNWTEHYQNMKKNKPDLIIADMHCYQIFKFAKQNNIPAIVHYAESLQITQDAFNFPTFRRSFGIGGFTIFYPSLHIFQILRVQTKMLEVHSKNLFFINSCFGFDKPQILPPNCKLIGPIIRKQSVQKNQDSLQCQEWIQQKKKQGHTQFIYTSFGTVAKVGEDFAKVLYEALCQLNMPVLWSFKSTFTQKMTNKNFFIREWLPQINILKREQVKLFVTHCGWNSVNQAVHFEKPLFLVPVCYDHPQIAQQCINLKIGINIVKQKFPLTVPYFNPKGYKKQEMVEKLKEVLQNPIYKQNIAKVHRLSKYTKTTELIVDSAKEVMQEGTNHLVDLNFQKAQRRKHWKTVVLLIVIFLIYVLTNALLKQSQL